MLFDCIVVGAGIEGSSTARQLLLRGAGRVLLLEQFEACHDRGSSCGQSRITRRAYETLFYVKMMDDAFRMWSHLESESGTTLYKRTGLLVMGERDSLYLNQTRDSLRKAATIPHEVLTAAEANRRYSRQLKLPEDHSCVFENDGGILYAHRALQATQNEFVRLGGVFLDQHRVTQITPGDVVTVVTERGSFRAGSVVLAVGPWAPSLCSSLGLHLPLEVCRIDVNYWKVEDPSLFSPDSFPVFIYSNREESDLKFYGIPSDEYPGLIKVCCHHGVPVDPDNTDTMRGPLKWLTEKTSKFISSTFRGVAEEPSITELCLYTMTPDTHPVIDRHPSHQNIIIAAGFSGHGFKLGPVFGKLLAELVLNETPSHDLHPFRVSRFMTQKSSL